MTELPEIPIEEAKVGVKDQPKDRRGPGLYPEPDLDIPILPEDPEVIAEREGIHERILSEIQHEDKEWAVAAEEMLEVSPEWIEVPDLMMEDKDGMMITEETATKGKRDEVARGRRKQGKEDDIRLEKNEHFPKVSQRIQIPAGFYSEDWDEFQQKEDE